MIKAGEISGSVPVVLERLIYIIEHEAKVRSDIKSALRYPMIVVIALVGAFIGLLTFVIPTFASVFIASWFDVAIADKNFNDALCVSIQVLVFYSWCNIGD